MPEVEAVAAQPEPEQRRPADDVAEARRRVGEGGEQERGGDRDPGVAAVPERQVVVVDVDEAEDQVAERDHPERVEDRADQRAEGFVGADLHRAPDQRQGDAREQADGVGVGAVVDAGGVVAGVEEDPGEDDRADRPGEHAEQQPAAAEELHPGGEDERPEEVELLLHRERPEVGEEARPPELFEVRGVGEDEVPVGEVEERGEGVAAGLVDLVRVGDRRDDHRHRDQHADRGEEAAGAADPEAGELDLAGAAELAQEQRGDQVAADDEEDVDAEEAARQPAEARVVAEDGEHGERPHRVDPRHVGEVAVLRPAHPSFTFIIADVSPSTIEKPRSAGPDSGLGGNWRVIVRNDNHNTFDHVAQTLSRVLPGVSLEQGHRIAEQIHNTRPGDRLDRAARARRALLGAARRRRADDGPARSAAERACRAGGSSIALDRRRLLLVSAVAGRCRPRAPSRARRRCRPATRRSTARRPCVLRPAEADQPTSSSTSTVPAARPTCCEEEQLAPTVHALLKRGFAVAAEQRRR